MHWHGPTGLAVREAREVVWQEDKGNAWQVNLTIIQFVHACFIRIVEVVAGIIFVGCYGTLIHG